MPCEPRYWVSCFTTSSTHATSPGYVDLYQVQSGAGGSHALFASSWLCSTDPGENVGPGLGVGDPINPSNGNKYLEDTDYLGSQWLTFRRFYNSESAISAETGLQWRHSFDRSLTMLDSPATTILMLRPDGMQELFTKASGVWTGDTALGDTLTETDNAQGVATSYAVFIGAERYTETYSATGVLQTVTDETGNGITLTYSTASTPANVAPAAGLLLTVTDPNGRQLNFIYISNGNVSKVTQPDGGTLTYTYNTSNNLISVQYPDTKTRQYVYNESALTGGTNLPGALTSIVDEAGVRYANTTYNSTGYATSSNFMSTATTVVEDTLITYNSGGMATAQFPLGHCATMGFTTVNGFNRSSSIDQPCGPDCDQSW